MRKWDRILTEDLNIGTGTGTKSAPGGGTATGTQVGLHSFSVGGQATERSWTPGTVARGSSVSVETDVEGADMGDFVLDAFSLDLQGLSMDSNVVETGVVETVLYNLKPGSDPVTVGAGTLRLAVLKCR